MRAAHQFAHTRFLQRYLRTQSRGALNDVPTRHFSTPFLVAETSDPIGLDGALNAVPTRHFTTPFLVAETFRRRFFY
jgi:hypothetical protein